MVAKNDARAITGNTQEVEVTLDITHSYVGDLVVGLTSPAGTSIPLHTRAGGSNDNIVTTYTPATTPALRMLRDQPFKGTWRLNVTDLAHANVGKLNRWALRIVQEIR